MADIGSIFLSVFCFIAIVVITIIVAYKIREMKQKYDDDMSTLTKTFNVGMSNAAAFDKTQDQTIAALKAKQQSDITAIKTQYDGDISSIKTDFGTFQTNVQSQIDTSVKGLQSGLTDTNAKVDGFSKSFKTDVLYSTNGMIVGANSNANISFNNTSLVFGVNDTSNAMTVDKDYIKTIGNISAQKDIIAKNFGYTGMLIGQTSQFPPSWAKDGSIQATNIYASGGIATGLDSSGRPISYMSKSGDAGIGGSLTLRGGYSEHNPSWSTFLPYAGDNKNYIRGDTEIRGNTSNIGDLNVGRKLCVKDACLTSDNIKALLTKI